MTFIYEHGPQDVSTVSGAGWIGRRQEYRRRKDEGWIGDVPRLEITLLMTVGVTMSPAKPGKIFPHTIPWTFSPGYTRYYLKRGKTRPLYS